MSLHQKPEAIQLAAAHLLDSSGFYTKDDGDPLDVLVKKFGEFTAETLTKLGASNDELKVLKTRTADLEQKIARRGNPTGAAEPDTIGKQFADNSEVKSFSEYRSRPSRMSLEIKTTIGSGSSSGGSLWQPQRDLVVGMPQRRLTIRDLMAVIQVSVGTVEYPKMSSRPSAAAPVAEAATKPESAMTFDLVTTPVRTIAHWIPASRQILDDAPQLKGIIDTELMYGLGLQEEAQLLYGDGTGQNLLGLVPQSTAYSAPFAVTGETAMDRVALAILQTSLTNLSPSGVILHPSDWMKCRLLKNGMGDYILGNPGATITPALWGLPVVATPAMATGNFLVGDFQAAGTIYDRWAARVEVSTEHSDFFVRNLIAILCEERVGLAVKQSLALTTGTLP